MTGKIVRMEYRAAAGIGAQLSKLDDIGIRERVQVENISKHGACITTSTPWRPGERVLVEALNGNFHSRARVVYCQPLESNRFAIGLEMFYPTGKWGT